MNINPLRIRGLSDARRTELRAPFAGLSEEFLDHEGVSSGFMKRRRHFGNPFSSQISSQPGKSNEAVATSDGSSPVTAPTGGAARHEASRVRWSEAAFE